MKLRSLGANQTEVEVNDRVTVLFSYQTPVAALVWGKGYLKTTEYYSKTTTKHINSWIPAGRCLIVPQAEIDNLVDGG